MRILFLLALMLPAVSQGAFYSGNKLQGLCRLIDKQTSEMTWNDGHDFGACIGYVEGISDLDNAYVGWGYKEPKFCIPKGATAGQLVRIVLKYLKENPAALHLDASSLVANAFYEAFPPSFREDGTTYCPD